MFSMRPQGQSPDCCLTKLRHLRLLDSGMML
uniref:Uncharacterized protein n=1 Tax=Arundo donax TaxID=35708 RepID=A0A0A9BJZ2_ARUDO